MRFISALIVAIGHYSGLLKDLWEVHLPMIRHLFKFNGPAAVIVFFIISGFCIHFPYREGGTPIRISSYYVRRLIRICFPAGIAICIWVLVGLRMDPPAFSIYWSVLCEVIYYLIFPALLSLRRRTSWEWIIGLSSLIAGSIVFLRKEVILAHGGIYPSSVLWTWLLGLPCWLMGCWLAEHYGRFPKVGSAAIWMTRVGIWVLAWVLLVLKFHLPGIWTSFPFTLNIFAWLAAGWVGLEIARYLVKKPWTTLEWAGTWTYSLYLMHEVATPLVMRVGINPSCLLGNFLLIFSGLALSYLFFLTIEKPCHQLAVQISNRLR